MKEVSYLLWNEPTQIQIAEFERISAYDVTSGRLTYLFRSKAGRNGGDRPLQMLLKAVSSKTSPH